MHAGKRFNALIDSGAALSLTHTSVYNMIEDCYKTKMLHAAVHLKTADGSWMSLLGKATLHLHIANFMFSHTFVIYVIGYQTQVSYLCIYAFIYAYLFGIDIQKRHSPSYSWHSDKQLFIQGEGSFFTYIRNCEQQHNIAVVKSPLKYHLGTMASYQLPSKTQFKGLGGILQQ